MGKRSREMLVHALLEALRQKGQLNNIEKDILSTADVWCTIPFNREKEASSECVGKTVGYAAS